MNNGGYTVSNPETGSRPSPLPDPISHDSFVIGPNDRILVTGAGGFMGSRVVEGLQERGFRNLVCFARPSGKLARLHASGNVQPDAVQTEVFKGNLLSRADCETVCKDVAVIFHLAAGKSDKSFADAFANSVVATRNLLEASRRHARLRRFVLVSSFAVYSNRQKARVLDELSPIEEQPELRGEPYCFAKVKQEQIVTDYAKKFGIPYVVLRPGSVYGEGQDEITGRVGLGTFGPFLHLGGSNTIPFTYVENCAEAIILAGLVKGIDGETFNVVDDDLPSSRRFLRLYKNKVRRVKSVYVPHLVSYALCYLWEKYSQWSEGQLPPVFNRRHWHANWRKTRYTNAKLKTSLGWMPKVSTAEGLQRYFASCRHNN